MEQLRKVSAFAEAYKTEIRRGAMRSEEHRDQLAGFLQIVVLKHRQAAKMTTLQEYLRGLQEGQPGVLSQTAVGKAPQNETKKLLEQGCQVLTINPAGNLVLALKKLHGIDFIKVTEPEAQEILAQPVASRSSLPARGNVKAVGKHSRNPSGRCTASDDSQPGRRGRQPGSRSVSRSCPAAKGRSRGCCVPHGAIG